MRRGPEVIEVEVFGADSLALGPNLEEVRGLCVLAASALGASDGHLAVEFIDARRIAELNARYRGKAEPTDVLSFPIDGTHTSGREAGAVAGAYVSGDARASSEPLAGRMPATGEPVTGRPALGEPVRSQTGMRAPVPSELGDVLICPEHTTDVREAVVHGVLHLLGMDHETDNGEMLALQAELLASANH